MKRTPKWAFFIVAILIVVFSYTAVFGVYSTYGDRVDTVSIAPLFAQAIANIHNNASVTHLFEVGC